MVGTDDLTARDMDQFSAHLDRGWDLVQRGDSDGAELSGKRALEIDNQSPEAYNLLGYVAALKGEFEDAVEHYTQAIALDDTYLEAMLNAAEVYIHPLGEFDDAIAMCEHALDLAESEDEVVDALLLHFDALLGRGDMDAAKVIVQRFPKGPFDNPNHTFLVGRAYYETGAIEESRPLVEDAVKRNPTNPEAQYYLGLILDELGEAGLGTQAFLRSRELDLEQPAPAWSLTHETFQMTAKRALASLEDELKRFIRQEEVYVCDVPGVEVVVDGVDPRALLLLDSVSLAPDDPNPTARVFVYQRNVERLAGAIEYVQSEIRSALERELTAAFLEPPAETEPNASVPPDSTAH